MWEGGSTSHFKREDGSISRKFPSIVVTLLDRLLSILKKSYLRAPNPPFLTTMKSSGPFLHNNAHEKLLASD